MSALLESLAEGFSGNPARRKILDAALDEGLPGPRCEAWKYTSLRALERRSFAAPRQGIAAFDAAILAGIPAPRLVFVNGRFDPAHSETAAMPEGVTFSVGTGAPTDHAGEEQGNGGAHVFSRLNAALAADGAVVHVAAHASVAQPLHLVSIGTMDEGDVAWHLRHRVKLEEGATLSLVEHQLADGSHRHLENTRVELRLGAHSDLEHVRLQASAAGMTSFLRTDAYLAESAGYSRIDLELDAALSRHELNVRLEGDGARLVANGVLLATGKRQLDTRLGIEHVATDTSCELQWRGLGAGRGRAVFHGGITIHAGADGSDANLSNKNLLLGQDAEIDTQPVLVIHADEVKAAHGATVGQLDPTALFYLRSRGLALDAATRLLTTAFVRQPLAAIRDDALRSWAESRLDAALRDLVGE
jgi:Fe-S cluster assembly protein SufD